MYGGIAGSPDSYALDCAGKHESLNKDVWVRAPSAGDWLLVRVASAPPARYKHKCTASLEHANAMVCVGGIGGTSAPWVGTTLSDTWLFSLSITRTEHGEHFAYGRWTLLNTAELPIGPRHSFVMLNSPRQSDLIQTSLEGFVVFGGSSSTACVAAAQPGSPASQWAHSDVWMLIISGINHHANNTTAFWLQLFPLNPPSYDGHVQDISRAAHAGAMLNGTLLVYGGHTAILSPSAQMPASTLSLQGSHCLAPSSAEPQTALPAICFLGANSMNVTVQTEVGSLDSPDLQSPNASCDISVHLEDESGTVLTYTTFESRRCATMHACSTMHAAHNFRCEWA